MSSYYNYSSGSSCRRCNAPYPMTISGSARPTYIAYTIFEGITFLILAGCVLASLRSRWTDRDGRKARMRTATFFLASLFGFLYHLLTTVDAILHLVGVYATYKYTIYYIFTSLLWRLHEFLILAVIFSIIQGRVLSKLIFPFKWAALILVGLMTAAAFVLYVVFVAGNLRGSGWTFRIQDAQSKVNLTYLALYVVSAIVAFVFSLLFAIRQRSKSAVLLVLVTLAQVLRVVVELAYAAWISDPSQRYQSSLNDWANRQFIFSVTNLLFNIFMTWIVFVGVALIALMRDDTPPGYDKGMGRMASVEEEHYIR